MAQQIHTSPELNGAQVEAIATALKPYAGQEVIIHCTSDTVVRRLTQSIAIAFNRAQIKYPQFTIDMDKIYQGVAVAVHANEGHPPLADALLAALRQQGISVTPVAADQVPIGKVAIYLGPQ
jgi:hypothetical protein